MTTIPRIQQSIFPDYPREQPAIDKEGNFNMLVDLGLGSLFQALQDNFKNEGILFPPLSASDMTALQGLYASYIGGPYSTLVNNIKDISGQTVFDKDTYTTNQFVIAQDNTGTVTMAQWVPVSVMLTHAGNPNGAVAGVLNWLCYDTAGMALYICTTAGSAAAAVWTPV